MGFGPVARPNQLPMLVQFGIDHAQPEWNGAVVCIGAFDGVHLGHQEVIRHAVAEAAARDLPCVLVTFDRHPAATLRPDKCPPAIATLSTNLNAFASLGVALAVVLPFDAALAATSAEDFLSGILIGKLKAVKLVVGHDFAMGHDRIGTAAWLAERIDTEIIQPFIAEGHRVSSSEIRKLVASGEVAHAAILLGKPFEIAGIVVGGEKLGRTLGYPTLNLARISQQVLPADGVYAGVCDTPLGEFKAAISIGDRPTVNGQTRTIEAFLIDYPGNAIYGQTVRLRFTQRLRGQEKFDSLDALKAQMDKDVQRVVAGV